MEKHYLDKFSSFPLISNSNLYIEENGILLKKTNIILKDCCVSGIGNFIVYDNSYVIDPFYATDIFGLNINNLKRNIIDDEDYNIIEGKIRYNRINHSFNIMIKMEAEEFEIVLGMVSSKLPTTVSDLYNSKQLTVSKIVYAINYRTNTLGTREDFHNKYKKDYIFIFDINKNEFVFLDNYSIIDFNNGIIVGSGLDNKNIKNLISIEWNY